MPAFTSAASDRTIDDNRTRPGTALGRFELRKMLGQGARSTAWLGFDPQHKREVRIQVVHPTNGVADNAMAQWLQEVRRAGAVSHPSIVPLYAADAGGGKPYLVYEYVPGSTLAELLKQRGALPPMEALALVMDVLDAMAVAHHAGVVHRDIQPSSILLDGAGRARVMDLGLAWHPGAGTEAGLGPAASPDMDVFACAQVLAELLTGKPWVHGSAPDGPLALPPGVVLDDRLQTLVSRALALDPQQRFSSARALQQALEACFQPSQPVSGDARDPSGGSTLDFLVRRMRHKSDFPAMSDAVVRIQSMATSDKESVGSVTNEILKDVALTNKLLRMVNSAHFAHGGNINTVSRAVSLVGFNGIRNMALSLVLLEHMQDKTHAALLKEEFLRSLMAGAIAEELCPVVRDSEEAFIGSMFQNLGRLLVQFYFPEEAAQIRSKVRAEREPVSEASASHSVLGLSFENLGIGISKSWGLPDGILRCMRKPLGGPPSSPSPDPSERIRWVAVVANEIADLLLHSDPKRVSAQIDALSVKYARAIGSTPQDMQAATARARQKMVDLAAAMEIRVAPHSHAARLIQLPGEVVEEAASSATESEAALGALELHATQAAPPVPARPVHAKTSQVAELLAAGIQDITNAMVEDFKLTDVLRMILETMFRALEFQHIVFCMRDAKTDTVVARFGLGEGVEKLVPLFKTHLKAATPDLFAVVCLKGVDSLISDASESRIKQRLPQWYLQGINAPTFLLLPLQIKGAPFGLIYADKTQRGTLELDEKELALLRTLRNQAVMAFKQST